MRKALTRTVLICFRLRFIKLISLNLKLPSSNRNVFIKKVSFSLIFLKQVSQNAFDNYSRKFVFLKRGISTALH